MADPQKFRTKPAGIGAGLVLLVAGYLAVDEGLSVDRYTDVAGIPTICYGHTGASIPDHATVEQCESLLFSDARKAIDAVHRQIHVPLSTNQTAALARWTYNLGEGALQGSTLAREANAGAPPEQWCPRMMAWTYIRKAGRMVDCKDPANGCTGLARRREEETKLCLTKDETP